MPRRSLARSLVLVLAVCALQPALIGAVLDYRIRNGHARATDSQLVEARADQVEATVVQLNGEYAAAAQRLALLGDNVRMSDPVAATRALRLALDTDAQLRRIVIAHADGRVAASSQHSLVGSSLEGERWFHDALRGGPVRPFLEQPDLVTYAVRILGPDGAVTGVGAVSVSRGAFAEALEPAARAGVLVSLTDELGAPFPSSAVVPADAPGHVERTISGGWRLRCAMRPRAAGLVLAPLLRDVLFICGLGALLALAANALLVRRTFARLNRLTAAARSLSKGDYAVRASLEGDDDVAALGGTFDEMAAALSTARASIEEMVVDRTRTLQELNDQLSTRNVKLAEQSEELAVHRYREQAKGRALAALTADADLGAVISAALGELAGPIGAAVMVCYQVEGEDRRDLSPIASYAASESARTARLRLDGLAEQALLRGRVEILDHLPDEVELRFDCLVAAGRPRSLALIPLAVGKRRGGLIMVGGLAPFTHETLAPLCDLASPIALTIARHTLVDETERIARELSRRNAELAEQAAELEAQGEELKAHQAELELKNREVEKADRLKSEFLANMSHELRTPLNAVIGFSELLLEERGELKDTHVQYCDDIHTSGRHLLTLINRVLDLAKIEAGSMKLSLESVDPGEAITNACTLVRPQAHKAKIELQLEQFASRNVNADPGKLQQILLNLLANAVKFSPGGSVIRVGARDAGSHVRFYVIDQGPGIDPELQPQLFRPFFQAENPMVKKHAGTGLGLAISQRLVEQHGGTIGCDSLPGHGSTFWFTLPPAFEDAGEEHPPAPPAAEPSFPKEPRVLIADDHDLNRELVRTLLERKGCRVLVAKDGEEALQLARAERPDLILLDLAMPRLDGVNAAAELRADGRTAQIPLVAFTAVALSSSDDRMQNFDAYLPKPVDRRALEAMVARLLATSMNESAA